MSTILEVEWFVGRNKDIVGKVLKVLEGPAPVFKIVLIEHGYRGRRPKPGDRTRASFLRDTRPDEDSVGGLLAHPIIDPDPKALTREQAIEAMQGLIDKEGPVFGERWIEVNLPGWQGVIHGYHPKRVQPGPVSMTWVFNDDINNHTLVVCPDRPISRAIVWQRNEGVWVMNCALAVHDLGMPVSVEPSMGRARVVWKDNGGITLTATMFAEEAFAYDGCISNIRIGPHRYVRGTLTALKGRWVEDIDLAVLESCSEKEVKRARFLEDTATYLRIPDVKSEVVRLLQENLRSTEWHRQEYLSVMLSPESRWERALWEEVRKLQNLLADQFIPTRQSLGQLIRVEEAQTRVREMSLRTLHFVDSGHPEIYGSGIPDDSTETARMRAENTEALQFVDTEIERLKIEVGQVAAKHADSDLPVRAWVELGEMAERVNAFVASDQCQALTGRDKERVEWWTWDIQRDLKSALEDIQPAQHNIEERLASFCRTRDAVRYYFERLREVPSLEQSGK